MMKLLIAFFFVVLISVCWSLPANENEEVDFEDFDLKDFEEGKF